MENSLVDHRAGRGAARWEVRTEEGSPSGGLYELEVRTYFHVVDRRSSEVVKTFVGLYEASYWDGDWVDGSYSGVERVEISEDGGHAVVYHVEGSIEHVALPVD